MIDFKSMKKVQDDEKMAVLQHEKGHQVKIVKSALSPVLLKQLSKLPLHQASPKDAIPDTSYEETPDAPAANASDVDTGTPVTKGAGSDSEELSPADPRVALSPEKLKEAYPKFKEHLNIVKQAVTEALPEALKSAAINTIAPGAQVAQTLSEQPAEAAQTAPEAPQAAAPAPEQPAAVPEAPAANKDPLADIFGANQQLRGMGMSAKATQTYQDEVASQEALQALRDDKDAQYAKGLRDKYDDVEKITQDLLTKKIDPNHYMSDRSTPQKFAQAIGLILGGISSGQTGQPNPVLDFINRQIDRDIESQKSTAANQHNLLSALTHQYGDQAIAQNMYRAVMLNKFSHELNTAAAMNNSAQAKAANMIAQGEFKRQMIPLIQQSNIIQQLSGKGQPGGAAAIPPEQKLLLYQKIGQISPEQYTKANEQLGNVQKTYDAHNLIDTITDKIAAEQSLSNRLGSPIQSTQRIAALKAQLIPLILDAEPSKRLTPDVLKQEVDPLVGKFLSNKSTLQEFTQGMHNIVNAHADAAKELRGLQSLIGAIPEYRGNARAVRGADGKNYVRSPDGRYMIPIK